MLQNLSQPELELAMNDNQAAFWTAIGDHASLIDENHHDSQLAWIASGIDMGYSCNFVMPLRLGKAEQDEAVAASIARAKKRKVRSEWWISPVHVQDGLGQRLIAQGFAHTGDPPAMAVELANLNEDVPRPTNFTIKRVDSESRLREWVDTAVEGWPGPEIWRPLLLEGYGGYGFDRDLRHYVGYVDGAPATVSSVILAAGVAGIYAVVTRAEFRRRGLGALITLAPLQDARDAGYRVGILQASEIGQPVYERLGFVEVFRYQSYLWPAPENPD